MPWMLENRIVPDYSMLTPAPRRPKRVLVALGKNKGVGWSDARLGRHGWTSGHSKVTALAAVQMAETGEYEKVIFSTGKTSGPDAPSESSAMYKFASGRRPFPAGVEVVLEQNSYDTSTNAEEVAKLLTDEEKQRTDVLTVGYHGEGAGTLFERFGIRASVLPSEEVISEGAINPEKFIESFNKSKQVKAEKRREKVRSFLLKFDRKGKLLRLVTGFFRK